MKLDVDKIKRTLLAKKCNVHDEPPKVSTSGNNVKIDYACCDAFMNELTNITPKLIADAGEEAIKNAMGKMFRR